MEGATIAQKAVTEHVQDGVSPPSLDWGSLPPSVTRLRTRILQAVAARDIAGLLVPIQWNEVPPLFVRGQSPQFDPIAYLKGRSFDGQGREMLRIIGHVFRQPFSVQTRGGSVTYLWPRFPVEPEREPADRIAEWRCVRFADIGRSTEAGLPVVHRTSIGIDGTWHYFWTEV